jgi:hypothetical protein
LANEWSNIRPLLEDSRLESRGYVNVRSLGRALDLARHGIEFNISGLVQTLALEIWLRSLEYKVESRRSASMVPAPSAQQSWTMRAARAASAV